MAKQLKLKAELRGGAGRSVTRKLRQGGLVPANIYGKDLPNQNLQINAKEFSRLLSHTTSEHVLVDLEIADGGKTSNRLALVQEVQHHPLRADVLHVDFHAVREDEMLHAAIPVEAFGEADGVKNFGGTLELAVHELEVECLPKDLPEIIRIDVSALGLGQAIHVRDLQVPEGVTVKANPDLTVVLVAAPRVEVEPAPGAAAAAQPEVLKEKKEEPKAEEKK
jgi:large subunit ribosomal protein L25